MRVGLWVTVASAVAVGSVIGSLARAFVTLTLAPGQPLGVLAVNLVGCLAAGWAAPRLRTHHPVVRDGVIVGVLGGFTTFSAFIGDSALLATGHEWVATGAYVALTLLLCPIAALAGSRLHAQRGPR